IHLELVSCLTTSCFLSALRRFISRRGIVHTVYSDNATTFHKAASYLRELFDAVKAEETQEFLNAKRITWKFNAPNAAWWGGQYERMIRTVKNSLKLTLKRSLLNFEELSTVLCELEAVVNSRPLYRSPDDKILQALTPADLLIGQRLTRLPDPSVLICEEPTSSLESLTRRAKYRDLLVSNFWKKWKSEYLLQ